MDGKPSLVLITLLCVVLFALPASAGFTYGSLYGSVLGEVDFLSIQENSTTDPNTPLYGTPTRSDNWLWFFPNAFVSSSSNGLADTTSSQLKMSIQADPNTYLSKISIIEYGDYSLAGSGSSSTQAKISGTMFITDQTPGHIPTVKTVSLAALPKGTFTLPSDSSGMWSASLTLDLTGYEISKVMFQFNNILQTASQSGTTSFIEKKVVGGPSIGVMAVPEPATLCLVAVGGLGLLRRRIRKT